MDRNEIVSHDDRNKCLVIPRFNLCLRVCFAMRGMFGEEEVVATEGGEIDMIYRLPLLLLPRMWIRGGFHCRLKM